VTKHELLKALVEKRINEIELEKTELMAELRALDGNRTGRAATPHSSGGQPGRQRRRRKGGTRSEQVLKLVTATPGIRANEIAEQLSIQPNYVYRVVGDLVKESSVTKDGRGYFPVPPA